MPSIRSYRINPASFLSQHEFLAELNVAKNFLIRVVLEVIAKQVLCENLKDPLAIF